MIQILIEEEVESTMDLVDMLNTIAELVKKGYTSGYYPTWKLMESPNDSK